VNDTAVVLGVAFASSVVTALAWGLIKTSKRPLLVCLAAVLALAGLGWVGCALAPGLHRQQHQVELQPAVLEQEDSMVPPESRRTDHPIRQGMAVSTITANVADRAVVDSGQGQQRLNKERTGGRR
jgi:hypothetical protein